MAGGGTDSFMAQAERFMAGRVRGRVACLLCWVEERGGEDGGRGKVGEKECGGGISRGNDIYRGWGLYL